MAVTATPAFTQAARLAMQQFGTANTNRDGSTGTYSSAVTAGANGSLIDYILLTALSTTTAGIVRIFYSDDSGSTYRLMAEVLVTAITPSGTVAAWTSTWVPPGGVPMNIPSTGQFRFNTNNGETFNAFVHGGNL